MDIREALRTSELWALVAAFVLSVLKDNGFIDPVQSGQWIVALVSYGAMRFIGKTAKASVAPTNGGTQ